MNRKKRPETVIDFYTKLYLKRKELPPEGHGCITEATKSWLLLSNAEKQQFTNQFKKYKDKRKQAFAEYLKNSQPYMKKKSTNRVVKDIENLQAPLSQNESVSYNEMLNENQETIDTKLDCRTSSFDEESSVPKVDSDEPHSYQFQQIIEPQPPAVKTARELFEYINEEDDWNQLSNKEKYMYSNAVRNLKVTYIKHYKQYLESLESEKLFEYYNRHFRDY